jgi:hypothetical protein
VTRQDRLGIAVWVTWLRQQLSSPLSSELSSARGLELPRPDRFLIPATPVLRCGCVKGGEAMT